MAQALLEEVAINPTIESPELTQDWGNRLLEEVAINLTIESPELTQDWGNRLLEGTNETSCAPGPRRKEQ